MVRWIAIPLVLSLVACGNKNKGGTVTPGEVPDAGPILVKQTLVHFGTENTTPQADVPNTKIWLVVTNETGSAKNYPIDEIAADCTTQPGGDMGALGTLDCQLEGTGASYIAVARGDEIILLRKAIRPGEDDHDYEELSRVQVPVGSKLAFSTPG